MRGLWRVAVIGILIGIPSVGIGLPARADFISDLKAAMGFGESETEEAARVDPPERPAEGTENAHADPIEEPPSEPDVSGATEPEALPPED